MLEDLRELYQEVILDHSRAPRNFGRLDHPTGDAEGHNPLCGDVVHVFLTVSPDHVIQDIAFQAKGCAISIASASMMSEIAKGKTVEEFTRIFELFHDLCTVDGQIDVGDDQPGADVVDHLRVLSGVRGFPMRVKCATLSWHTMKAALAGKGRATTEEGEV
jgi:nitrogen fixation protein NifU and related proteins